MEELELLAEKGQAILLATGERWAQQYSKAPDQHAKLIKTEAKLQIILTKYFRDMAQNADKIINYFGYHQHMKADYSVDVIINDQELDNYDGTFITLVLDPVTTLITTGAQAGGVIYKVPLNIQGTDANIQALSTQRVAALVGKRVNKDGTIVDNPKAEYNINQTVRNDIAQSIKTSLGMGEDLRAATARVQKVISNPARAERIARTESVNAYQAGLTQFGKDSGAVGKEWQDAGASDVCADNTAAGPIPFDDTYPSGDTEPTAHVNCRCGQRLIYQQEWDGIQDGNPLEAQSGITDE